MPHFTAERLHTHLTVSSQPSRSADELNNTSLSAYHHAFQYGLAGEKVYSKLGIAD